LLSFTAEISKKKKYHAALQKNNIKAISFAEVLDNVYNDLNYYGYDSPRQYIYLMKMMGYIKTNAAK
jgi:predicted unusual protein kinase regulating ubiquinone biosynthesis (AarF/ABC1/UbiB family)